MSEHGQVLFLPNVQSIKVDKIKKRCDSSQRGLVIYWI